MVCILIGSIHIEAILTLDTMATDDAGNKENQVAHNIRRPRKKHKFTPAPETALDESRTNLEAGSSSQAQQILADDMCTMSTTRLINAVKDLGFYPKETKATDEAGKKECKLAHNIRMVRKRRMFTAAQEKELDELRQNSVHPRGRDYIHALPLDVGLPLDTCCMHRREPMQSQSSSAQRLRPLTMKVNPESNQGHKHDLDLAEESQKALKKRRRP